MNKECVVQIVFSLKNSFVKPAQFV